MNDKFIEKMNEHTNELSDLIETISADYIESDDEYENELFYSGMQKAKEFCSNLRLIIKHRSEKD